MARALTSHTSRTFRLVPVALCLWLAVAAPAWAQTSATDGKTPSGLAPGSPAGSYALSGFETVNLYNGGLSFRLPLKGVGGRGEAGYAVTLPVEQKWIVKAGQPNPSGVTPLAPSPNWWQGTKPGYSPGVMHGRRAVHEDGRNYEGYDESAVLRDVDLRTLTRLTFTASDGTEYELRDQVTGGEPKVEKWYQSTGNRDGFSRGTVFVTADGTSATFISGEEVRDFVAPTLSQTDKLFYPSGVLLLADGTRYAVSGGLVTAITDRNGNRVTFNYGTGTRVLSATDQLGRQVTFTYDDGVRHYDEIAFKGFGGAARRVRVWYAPLESRLRPNSEYATQYYKDLFNLNSASTQTKYNPQRVSEVELPDGRRYQLYYNPYGELARVVLPTGGVFEYDWDGALSAEDAAIFRHVTERRVYSSGGTTPAHKVQYARVNDGPNSIIEVSTRDGAGALLARSRHHFHGDAFESMVEDPARPGAISYGTWREGREYKTEELAADGTTVLRRVEQTWAQRAPVPWWALGAELEPPNDPRVVQTVTTLADVTPNLVSKQTYAYDQYSNRTDSYEYDFGAGAAGPLIRRTHTDYVTAAAYVGAAADPTVGAHLRALPSLVWVSSDAAGNGKVSRTAYEYDNYTDDARHDPLVAYAVTGITGLDAAAYPASFTRRGNVTSVTSYAAAAAQTGVATASTTYDIAGSPLKSIDALGRLSTVGYADSFSNPASGAGAYTPYTYAFPTSNSSPVPDPAGTYGSNAALTTATKYDFHTGLIHSSTDANGKVTSVEYSGGDELDRPKAVVRPDGGRTDYEYGDAPGNLYVRTRSDLDATRRTDSYRYYDRLGRPYRSMLYENQVTAEQWVVVDKEYDALGRVRRASMPYRSAPGAAMFSTDKWTQTAYDALGRVTAVTTKPDDAAVTTVYSGNRVTITDQAGKVRRSVTDALGRLVRVDEPNVAGALDVSGSPAQPTHYTYDAAGNLRKVTQGAQLRFFMYDSLGRLTRAKNPEQAANPNLTSTDPVTGNSQWSLSYSYDAAGNLISKTDARGVTALYSYDALDRNTAVNYSDATPDVTRYYDGATLGKGRVWKSEAAATARTTVSQYDPAGRPKASSQQFWSGGAWGASFPVTRTYDEAGNVTSQIYPSGHRVSYTYDAAGRPAGFAGNLGDGAARSYSSGIVYDELGGRSREQFGTQTPLYSKRFYNERGQLSEVRLGTYHATSSSWWNRGAILNVYSASAAWTESGSDNNGNLRKQMVFVPNDDQISGWWQTNFFYDYDSLNRLDRVREVQGQDLWAQDYEYDRWGNRTVNAVNTQVYGSSPAYSIPEPQFTASSATNRLSPPAGYAMTYDQAGNLTFDNYAGGGSRSYDAEGRMTSAQFLSGQTQTATYAYDADGRRVKRDAGAAAEVWQVYGMGGELLAEYAAGAAPSTPRKEYGYREGELLVTLEAAPAGGQVHDAVSGFSATQNPSGAWAYGYRPASGGSFTAYASAPSLYGAGAKTWAQSATSCCPMVTKNVTSSDYTYAGAPSITQPPDLLNLHPGPSGERSVVRWTAPAAGSYVVSGRFQGLDNVGTTTDVLVTHNGATLFGGGVTGHGSQAPFAAAFTAAAGDTLEFSVGRGANATYSNDSTGLAATVAPAAAVGAARWLVTDHLGTPRMVVDQAGTLAGVSRHDYMPFGEEIGAGVGGRTAPRGYAGADGVRQKLTGHERDEETGLDFMQARYYDSAAGRFTSVDPLLSSAQPADPQTWNRYAYVLNRPTIAIDPAGLSTIIVTIAPRSRGGDGRATVQVFNRDGHDVNLKGRNTNRFEGKAVGGGADRTRTGNDTPFGVYKILPNHMGSNENGTQGGGAGKSARGKDERFGTGILTLQAVSGEAKDADRKGIYIHGGPPVSEGNQDLRRTEGCVRGHNDDVNALLGTVNDLAENGDPVTNVFMGDVPALNAMADQKDWDGSYLYPQLRNAGFGNETGRRPPGSVPNTQPEDSLRRPKE